MANANSTTTQHGNSSSPLIIKHVGAFVEGRSVWGLTEFGVAFVIDESSCT